MEEKISIFFILAIVINGLWYWTKVTLQRNGYPVSWFWNHLRDIPNMFRLARETKNPLKKRSYYLMANAIPILTIMAFFYIF